MSPLDTPYLRDGWARAPRQGARQGFRRRGCACRRRARVQGCAAAAARAARHPSSGPSSSKQRQQAAPAGASLVKALEPALLVQAVAEPAGERGHARAQRHAQHDAGDRA